MIKEIGNILIGQIDTLPFLDKYTGVVKVITMADNSAGRNVKKIFPVACNLNLEDCNKGKRYLDFVPDDSKKSVLYLEDTGLRFQRQEGNRTYWKASYNLVCWLNLPKLGSTSCSYSAIAILSILKSLPIQPFNANDTYNQIKINLIGQQPKSTNPFARYSYDESVSQFLMYPFDYFVLALDVDFMVDLRCVVIPDLSEPINCIKK